MTIAATQNRYRGRNGGKRFPIILFFGLIVIAANLVLALAALAIAANSIAAKCRVLIARAREGVFSHRASTMLCRRNRSWIF
jgi:hypothetical protein